MRISEDSVKKELPFTVNLSRKEERDNLDELGKKAAEQIGLHYDGYWACTVEPYSIEKAKPTLFFC
jgi:hypothetical protein